MMDARAATKSPVGCSSIGRMKLCTQSGQPRKEKTRTVESEAAVDNLPFWSISLSLSPKSPIAPRSFHNLDPSLWDYSLSKRLEPTWPGNDFTKESSGKIIVFVRFNSNDICVSSMWQLDR